MGERMSLRLVWVSSLSLVESRFARMVRAVLVVIVHAKQVMPLQCIPTRSVTGFEPLSTIVGPRQRQLRSVGGGLLGRHQQRILSSHIPPCHRHMPLLGAMRQRILGSHTPPCHRRMVITT